MTPEKKRVAILISGRGSNMQSLVAAARAENFPARIATVISNRPGVPGLAWAQSNGTPAVALDHAAYTSREAFESDLHEALGKAEVDLIALAGFMRLLSSDFVERWRDRMINIHPSLLPAYRGLKTHERALTDGVRIAGCTAHFVRPEMDAGPIIAQAAVPVLSTDTPPTLAARVLEAEHRLYPEALRLVASGRAHVRGEKVVIEEDVSCGSPLFSPHIGE